MPAADAATQPFADVPAQVRSFDLAELPERASERATCGASSEDEIVVCAPENQEKYRLRPLDPRYERTLEPGEFRITDSITGRVEVESHAMPDGTTSKRVMVRVKTNF